MGLNNFILDNDEISTRGNSIKTNNNNNNEEKVVNKMESDNIVKTNNIIEDNTATIDDNSKKIQEKDGVSIMGVGVDIEIK